MWPSKSQRTRLTRHSGDPHLDTSGAQPASWLLLALRSARVLPNPGSSFASFVRLRTKVLASKLRSLMSVLAIFCSVRIAAISEMVTADSFCSMLTKWLLMLLYLYLTRICAGVKKVSCSRSVNAVMPSNVTMENRGFMLPAVLSGGIARVRCNRLLGQRPRPCLIRQ